MTEKKPPKPNKDGNILDTLDEIESYLIWAKEQVSNNIEVELDGLDFSIETACDIVRESDQDTKDAAEPKIVKIVEHLEKLAETLRDHPMVKDGE